MGITKEDSSEQEETKPSILLPAEHKKQDETNSENQFNNTRDDPV